MPIVIIKDPVFIAGVPYVPGASVNVPQSVGDALVGTGEAVWAVPPVRDLNPIGAFQAGGSTVPGQTVVALGDSFQANAATVTGNIAYLHQSQASAITWACALLRQGIWLPYGNRNTSNTPDLVNYMLAVSGVTTQHVIDVQVPEAIARRAAWWSVQCGTNDLALLPADSVVQICNRIRGICQAGIAAGARVILGTIPPRNDAQWQVFASAFSAAGTTVAMQRAKQMAVNQWMRRWGMETPGVILADHYDQLVDPASALGEWRAGMSDDGIHWSNAGAFVGGSVIAKAAAPFVKVPGAGGIGASDIFSAANPGGNLATDAGFQGSVTVPTATGISGSVPTNWSVNLQEGTATAVCSVGARTDTIIPGLLAGGRELQIAVSTAAASSRLRAYGSQMSLLVPANTPFFCEMEVSVSANAAAWDGPGLQCFFSSPGSVNPQFGAVGIGPLPVGATFDAVIRTPISSSTVAAGQFLFAQMLLRASSAATMKIRRMGVYTLQPDLPGLLLGAA